MLSSKEAAPVDPAGQYDQPPQTKHLRILNTGKQYSHDPYFGLRLLGHGLTGLILQIDEERVVKKAHNILLENLLESDRSEVKYLNTINRETLMHEIQVYERLGSHNGIVSCFGTSECGIELAFAKHGNLENYIATHPEPHESQKIGWILSLIEALQHVHSRRVFIDDIALRNILVDEDGLKLSDFGQAMLLPPETKMDTVCEKDVTAKIEMLHLGWVIYSIAVWRVHKYYIFDQEDLSWPKSEVLPVVDGIFCGRIIEKCWRGEYASIEALNKEAHSSLRRELVQGRCSNCLHKGRGGSCIPFKSFPGSRSRPTASRPAPSTWGESGIGLQSPLRSQTHDAATPDLDVDTPEAESHSPEATHRTHPRMLRNLQGDRVYVGKAASLSFLQLLRDTVTQHIGPSQFSQRSEDMLETEAQHGPLNFSQERCNADEKRQFVQNYEAATSGFLSLGCRDITFASLTNPEDPKSDQEKTRAAIVDLMVAIGAQSRPNDPECLLTERFYFARGQQRSFANFLEDPSMDLVRVFVLMSFYMLGACRRNAAFMYLGVASRAAVALGLHEDSSGSTSRDDNDQRPKLWMSLCVLDLLVSSILGRPSAISPLLTGDRNEALWIETNLPESGLVASFHLSLILDEIVTRLYGERAASAETADVLLGKLNNWSETLPQSLRTSSLEHENENIVRNHTLGNMHVACSYHFAVILVTRPFLISALSVRLARLHHSLSTGEPGEAPEEDPAHSRLAAACIDSAVYMLQTCIEVHDSGLMLRNMCILKAFIFAAALVLGFSMFAHRDIDSEIDEAFRGAMTILRMLASQSAQAAHYLDITIMLEAAINQQRQRLAAQARQRRSQYVSRIFSLNGDPATPRRQREGDEQSSIATPLTQSIPSYSWLQSDDGIGTVTPPMIDGTLFDWEGMDLPLWDSFPFLTESSAI